jgi:hypothetical protein
VTTRTVSVPASIDRTGVSDVSDALNRWLTSVPDGSLVSFPADGVYLLSEGITLANRRNLVFEGNGATLRSSAPASLSRAASLFFLDDGNANITIRGFTLLGNSPTPGVYNASWEHASGITVVDNGTGGSIEVASVTVSGVGGDGFTLTGSLPSPSRVWIHDSHVVSAGRNGVAIISGSNVLVERNAFDRSGYCTFDIEPNSSRQGASAVTFRGNTAGTWHNAFVCAVGAAGRTVEGVTISGNAVSGGTLHTIIGDNRHVDTTRTRNVVFTNNSSAVQGSGPLLLFSYIDGLTVTGNVQPLTSGPLSRIYDSTGVVW